MKKFAIVLIAMIGFVSVANAQQAKKAIQGDNNNTVIASVSNDNQTSTSITFYNNSTKAIEVCVSVFNDQGSKVGEDCFSVPGAPSQGNHSERTVRLSKIRPCSATTSGCEVKSIEITSAKVQN